MRRSWMVPLAVLVAGLGLFAGLGQPVRAADPAYAGTWKVTVLADVQQLNFWILKFEVKAGKTTGSVVGTAPATRAVSWRT